MKKAYLIRSIEEFGKLMSLCIEKDISVFRTYWDEREKGSRCYRIDWQEKRCYYSSREYWENEGYEVVVPVFVVNQYGNYRFDVFGEKPATDVFQCPFCDSLKTITVGIEHLDGKETRSCQACGREYVVWNDGRITDTFDNAFPLIPSLLEKIRAYEAQMDSDEEPEVGEGEDGVLAVYRYSENRGSAEYVADLCKKEDVDMGELIKALNEAHIYYVL